MGFVYKFLLLALAITQTVAQGGPGSPGGSPGSGWNSHGSHNEWRGPPAPEGPWRGAGQSAGSPMYNYMFMNPLPIPPIAKPEL